MAYQVAVGISTNPFIKAGQGNLVRGIGSQKPAKALGIAPAPTVMSPANRTSYIAVTYI